MSRNVAGDLEKLGPVNSRDRVSHITLHDYNRQASLRVTYERVTQHSQACGTCISVWKELRVHILARRGWINELTPVTFLSL